MGDPRKIRAKYHGPLQPWQKERLDEEAALLKEYGLNTKKEIYRINSFHRKLLSQTKHLSAARLNPSLSAQAEKEINQFLTRLKSLNIIDESAKLDDVLNVSIKNIMERRLQTLVFRKGLARSMKQARQFITHRHIMVNGKPITSPTYLVSKQEEVTISFKPASKLSNPDHPERKIEEKPVKTKKEEKGSKEEKKENKKEEKELKKTEKEESKEVAE